MERQMADGGKNERWMALSEDRDIRLRDRIAAGRRLKRSKARRPDWVHVIKTRFSVIATTKNGGNMRV